MTLKVIWLAMVCSLSALLIGCSGDGTTLGPSGTPDTTNDMPDDGDNGDDTVTLATLSAEIFTPKCATSGCHSGPSAANGMSLEADVIAAEIIGIESGVFGGFVRVEPEDPDNSLIVLKVRGEAGAQMPLDRVPLSDEEIAKIVEWIEAGANP